MKKGREKEEQMQVYEEREEEKEEAHAKTYAREMEKLNYRAAMEARKKLDSIARTAERTGTILDEQREKLEEIREESLNINRNVEKGRDLTEKMKRAGKMITIGDKISDKIKGIFKKTPAEKPLPPRKIIEERERPLRAIAGEEKMKESPEEEDTNRVLLEIRDGLRDLQGRFERQGKEISEQVPIIEDITQSNKQATTSADKIIRDLKKI